MPGLVEIDLVGHDGSNSSGQFCFTLPVTDIATGWTVNRSVPNKARKHVFAALQHVLAVFPFPVIGIDSDNGSEFINYGLFEFCRAEDLARFREIVDYLRYDTAAELELLNEIWELVAGPDLHQLPVAAAKTHRKGLPRSHSKQNPRPGCNPGPARCRRTGHCPGYRLSG